MDIFPNCPSCGASLPAGIPERLKMMHITKCTMQKNAEKFERGARDILAKLDNIRSAEGLDDRCYNEDEQ